MLCGRQDALARRDTIYSNPREPRPDKSTLDAFVSRLKGTEYGNAVRDVLGLDLGATPLLPSDHESDGFDNIADVLKTSRAKRSTTPP